MAMRCAGAPRVGSCGLQLNLAIVFVQVLVGLACREVGSQDSAGVQATWQPYIDNLVRNIAVPR